ncbi:MAG: hypothetical protein ACW981_12085 [Candidatus Hodarchaeales archaeon]|jgi:hypothetical protein
MNNSCINLTLNRNFNIHGFDIVGNVFHTSVIFTIDTSTPTSTPTTTTSSSELSTSSQATTSSGLSIFI